VPPTLLELEDAFVAALLAQTGGEESYLKTCRLYDGGMSLEELAEEAKRMPAMLVAYAGTEPIEKLSPRDWRIMTSMAVLVMDRSTRRSLEARRGVYGTSRMIDDARTALVGRNLGLEIQPIGWPDEDPLGIGKFISAYELTFPVVMDVTVGLPGDPVGDEWIDRIRIYHDFSGYETESQADLTEE